MQHDGAADRRPSRGRVVVIVDNTVDSDSRVQKTARSAAQSGWDVVLIGRSPDDRPRTRHLGQVELRLVPVAPRGGRTHLQFLRRWLSEPKRDRPPDVRDSPRPMGGGAVDSSFDVRRRLLRIARASRGALRAPWDHSVILFWRTVMGDRSWRRLEPHLWEYERAYAPVIDDLSPDLVHANDFRMLGVGARAAMRARDAGRTVKLVWDAHEFLPGIKPWIADPRWLPGNCAHEREYARNADAVITVSDELAGLLQGHHGLADRPHVVLNAPDIDDESGGEVEAGGIRELCGVDDDVPLLVYSGTAIPHRGLVTMIDALPRLPDAHAALVVPDQSAEYVRGLASRAARLGVRDRLHLLAYVAHPRVVAFLAGADVGVIPIHHWPNHELALITKFFEYSHARLPIVVSDVRTMAAAVGSTGQGEVFRAEDTGDFVRAVRAVLADPSRYRAAYETPGLLAGWTWAAQAEVLDRVYSGLLPEPKVLA